MMMDAGRELDALVYEKVMGGTIRIAAAADHQWLIEGIPLKVIQPKYSTDIAAAWLVVEWAKKYGNMTIQVLPYAVWVDIHIVDPAVAESGGDIDATKDFRSAILTAPTAPLAICRAALAACGVPS